MTEALQKITRLIIAALFGSIIFVTTTFFGPPIDKMLIVVQAVLLGLAALFMKKVGATYAGAIGGALAALVKGATLGPFTFVFALLYGIFVDIFFLLFKVSSNTDLVSSKRAMIAMTLSTALIGLLSYYVTAVLFELVPVDPVLAGVILFVGTASGAVAGYAAAYLWNRYLKSVPF